MPAMIRFLLLPLAVAGAALLSACGPAMDEPYRACTVYGPQYQNTRGVWTADCREQRIMCTPPLLLDEGPNGKLMCRLRRENAALPPTG